MSTSRCLRHARLALFAGAACAFTLPGAAAAQNILDDWTAPAGAALELGRPFFDGGEFTTLSGFGYVSGLFGDGDTRVLVELPFARGGIDGGGSSSYVGAPYVGVAFLSDNPQARPSASIGVRLPVPESFVFGDDDFAQGLGVLGDPERLEAFLTEVATISGAARLVSAAEGPVRLRAQVDADLLVFTDPGGGDRVEFFAGWGGVLVYDGDAIAGSIGVTGRALLSEEGDDRVFHQLTSRAELQSGSVRPFLGLRLPIHGQLVEPLDGVLTLGVRVGSGS